MEDSKKKKRKLVIDIVSYSFLGTCFLFALIGVLLRFSGNSFYLFGSRFDVVLTNSMSEKNPKWEEFLKGHDNQIQAFDVVISQEVTSPKQLEVYDIVLFNNKQVGTDMHRIVGMIPGKSDDIIISKSRIVTLGRYEGIQLPYIESDVVSNAISIKEITLVTYSKSDYEGSHFNFNVQNTDLIPTITTESVDGGFFKTYKVTRDSTSPGDMVIAHKYKYDYASEIISSCTIKNNSDDIVINKNTVSIDGDNLVGSYNQTYLYEIRGDRAPNSDGYFSIDKIYSKVSVTIPKLGYIIRFLSSLWGSILLIGLGIMTIVFDIIMTRLDKSEKALKENAVEDNPAEEKGEKKDE